MERFEPTRPTSPQSPPAQDERPPAPAARAARAAAADGTQARPQGETAARAPGQHRQQREQTGEDLATIFAQATAEVQNDPPLSELLKPKADPSQSRTLLVSANPDGIGSIYFDGHRIRLGHPQGPKSFEGLDTHPERFQIDLQSTFLAFQEENQPLVRFEAKRLDPNLSPAQRDVQLKENLRGQFLHWASETLVSAVNQERDAPGWAQSVTNPETLQDYDPDEAHNPRHVLLEVFPKAHRTERAYHLSRGAPRKLNLTNDKIDTLRKAVGHAMSQPNPDAANKALSTYLHARDPALASHLKVRAVTEE